MSHPPLISTEELEAFAVEGVLVLDRPLTWEAVDLLLTALEPDPPPSGD